ncbi:hypothetical protein ACLMJK_006337 [Lecanora helva]
MRSTFLRLGAIALGSQIAGAIKAVKYLDNFDHPPSGSILPLANAVDGTAGGALYYNAFGYANLGTLENSTLVTASPPYNIGSGVTAQAKEGAPGWRTMNSSVLYFDETSIYYACQAYDATGDPAVGIPCTIQATGYKYGGGKPVTQKFVFTPSLNLPNKFAFGTFSSDFKGLVNVTLSIVPKLQQALTVIDHDSHSYTAYLKK